MKKIKPPPEMEFDLLGEDAVCMRSTAPVCIAVQRRCWALAAALRTQAWALEVVPGMNNLTVQFDTAQQTAAGVLAQMQALWMPAAAPASDAGARVVEIPVRYGGSAGPDLAVVAAHVQMTEKEVIAAHSGADYRVYFLGFQPGFAYLGGLPPALAMPRRAEPRLAVPAGAVGIGGAQTGIYPAQSPGGWQIIGHTDIGLFDATRDPPSLLQSGDIVRFVAQHADAVGLMRSEVRDA